MPGSSRFSDIFSSKITIVFGSKTGGGVLFLVNTQGHAGRDLKAFACIQLGV